jgi:hypothetical protein
VSERTDGGSFSARVSIDAMHALSVIAMAAMAPETPGSFVVPAPETPMTLMAPPSNAPQVSSKPTASGASAPPPKSASRVSSVFGAKDSWRWQVLGSWMNDFDAANQIEAEWSASWFFMQGVSMDFGLSGDAILQPGTDAGGGGASLMFRWHFVMRETWSLFADAGCGMLFTNEPVPCDGGRVNFTPRVGVGGTLDVGGDARLMAGVRWFHISNANTGQDNPGRDSIQLFAGVTFPF